MYKNFGLIGTPIEHTLSPLLHNYFLYKSGINGGYTSFDVKDSKYLFATVDILKEFKFIGLNITVPYKELIMELCDELDETALTTNAVNTLKIKDNNITGYNTDIFGIERLFNMNKVDLNNKEVLLIGAGGGGKSVTVALKGSNLKMLTIANRTTDRAEKLLETIKYSAKVIPLSSIGNKKYDIIINATSLGLLGNNGFDKIKLYTDCAIDLQYKPFKTSFLSMFDESKVKLINGFDMLLWQGYRAFSIWTEQSITINRDDIIKLAYNS